MPVSNDHLDKKGSAVHLSRRVIGCWHVSVVLTFLSLSVLSAAEYPLTPIKARGKHLWPGGLTVQVHPPAAWERVISEDGVAFVPVGTKSKEGTVVLEVNVSGIGSLDPPEKSDKNPAHSFTAANLEHLGGVKKIAKFGSFDGGSYGTLPIWEIQSDIEVFVVTIVRDHVVVDVALKADRADDLKEHLGGLKELVRSLRFVKPDKG